MEMKTASLAAALLAAGLAFAMDNLSWTTRCFSQEDGTFVKPTNCLLAPAAVKGGDGFVLGADVSWVTEMEKNGSRFKTSAGVEKDLFKLLRDDYGMKAVRLRVWVNPKDGWCGTEDTVAKAKRAKAAGMDVMIDFHYSDTWADPGHQTIPSAWAPFSNDVARVALLLADGDHGGLSVIRVALAPMRHRRSSSRRLAQ